MNPLSAYEAEIDTPISLLFCLFYKDASHSRRDKFWSRFIKASLVYLLVVFGLFPSYAASPASAQNYSIWDASAIPTYTAVSDGQAIEIGVRFRSSVDGYITGIRFYKGSANTGTHVGHLWSANGTLLASATFINETGSGWQEVLFSSPVPITVNTTYVASYHSASGYFAIDQGYFTAGVDNGPLRALAEGEDGSNGVYLYGAGGFPTDSFSSSNYWVDVVFQEEQEPDTMPPSVSSTEPVAGAVDVATGTSVAVTFSEAMDAATIDDATFELLDAADIPVAAVVNYTGATYTATLVPSSPLGLETTYTARVRGGAGGVSDVAGYPLASDYSWTFTTAATLVGDTTPPIVNLNEPAAGAVDVGIGAIVTVTFSEAMNAASINGTTFELRDAEDSPVASSVNYSSATYTATLAPINPLDLVTTYTARVRGGLGGVSDVTGNPLASDYSWTFTTSATSGGDTTRPMVTAVLPPNNAPAVSTGTSLTVTFSEAMSAATINNTTFELRNSSGASVPAAVTYDGAANRAVLTPNGPLGASAAYTATVKGGTSGVKDEAGNPLAFDYAWAFVSSASFPFGNGPGGPILVITSASNPFSRYYTEILRTEGLNAFGVRGLSSVSAAILDQYDVVILGEMPLTSAQVAMLTDWVTNGGNLITMRPDKKLAGLLGLVDTGAAALSRGYLLVDTSSEPGAGIVDQTIQFHGAADRYALDGATALATLYTTATTATANPAVTLHGVGSNGGQAAAFTFDLARSVVYTRQGNPAWVGQERDGIEPIRSDDLFYGDAAGDPQPDWIDLTKVAIPQADEQQRLLANMIIRMNADKMPLPRFWYFPNGHEAVVIMTGDDHGNDGTAGRYNDEIINSTAGCSVDNWECIRSSSYIYPDPDGAVTDAEAADYDAQGFEIGVHINTSCLDYTADMLETYFSEQMDAWHGLFPSLEPPVSHRQHCIAWSGYTVLPEEEAKYGIRLDVNYYYWPPDWISNRPGFFTGSGMPMRFAALNGTLIDVYQATTQMSDESGQSYPYTINTLLDRAIGPTKYYGAFTANMHTDYATSDDYEALIASAQARAVPVVSARQMLKWLDGRDGSSFGSLAWNGTALEFTISVGDNASGLQAMVPITTGLSVLDITRDGDSIGYVINDVKGISYAVFPALDGSYAVETDTDTTDPTLVDFVPLDGAVDVSRGTTVAATFSEAMNAASINAATFELRDGSNGLVSSTITYNVATYTATLDPTVALDPNATYTVTVIGGAGGVSDLAGNPLSTDYNWSFTTSTGNQEYSLWNSSTIPAALDIYDGQSQENGVKFVSDTAGYINGLRFYKGPADTGTHIGHLWTGDGTLLASATFTGEAASGWQEVMFSAPVPIAANTTYVASYYSPSGYHAEDEYYFISGVISGPLRALFDGEDGGNGVYRFGASGFPDQTFNATNYWVDVTFEESILTGDFDSDCDVDGLDLVELLEDISKMSPSAFAQNFGIAACQ
jgi:hypothetical protein